MESAGYGWGRGKLHLLGYSLLGDLKKGEDAWVDLGWLGWVVAEWVGGGCSGESFSKITQSASTSTKAGQAHCQLGARRGFI